MKTVRVRRKRKHITDESLNEEVFGSGILGVGYDNTMSAASYTVQGKNPGYTYQILPMDTTLQQKANEVDDRAYIHPGSWVVGVGANNPKKHFSGVVSRIVKNPDGSIAFLYIKTFKTNKFVTILADENLKLIINHEEEMTSKTFAPSNNVYV